MNWEEIFRSDNEVLSRYAVADGWIYRYMLREGTEHGARGYTWAVSITFVPAPAAPPP